MSFLVDEDKPTTQQILSWPSLRRSNRYNFYLASAIANIVPGKQIDKVKGQCLNLREFAGVVYAIKKFNEFENLLFKPKVN